MDPRTFLDNFGTIAVAPGGVDRLRELILDLAVHGQLVEQDPNDHPILTEALEAGRKGLIAQGQINKPRHPEGHPVQNPPYLIPAAWSWYHLGDVGAVVGGGTPSSQESRFWADGNAVPWLTPADMRGQISRYVTRGERDITEEGLASSSAQLLPARSVLFSSRAPIGHVGIAQTPLATNQGFKSCVPYLPDMAEYLYVFLKKIGPEVSDAATGTTFKEVSGKQVALIPVPVPPLAEQERIVAKVDELMQLCDDLEARQQARHYVTTRLRASSLDALTNAETADDVRSAWSRIQTNWEALTDHPDSIDALRRTILQLAVEGRLAVADPADTSADELLERIEPGSASRAAVDPSRTPYTVPANWRWVFLEYVCSHIVDCLHKTPHYVENGYRTIRTADVEPGRILLGRARHVDQQTYEERTSRLRPAAGDVVYSREGGRFGIAAVVPPDVDLCLGQRMMQFRCAEGVEPEYLCWFLNSPLGFGQASADVGGSASPHVNIKAIRRFLLPLPPTAEQRRIVWKVRELMGQCDQLEARLGVRNRVGSLLAGSMASSVAG